MKVKWLAAATLAVAAWTGLPLAAHAQSGVFTISDVEAEPAAISTFEVPALPASSTYEASTNLGGGCACPDKVIAADACPPWRLCPQSDCGWNLTGFINAGITGNGRYPADRFNGVTTFNDRNEGQINQVWLTLEKAIDTADCNWNWGGRVDAMWGSDYVFNQMAGFELRDDFSPHWNGAGNLYGVVVPQMYAEVGNDINSIKVGRFFTPIGYEVVPATGNFFYSHAYTHQYGEPFYHNGVLYTRTASDTLSWYTGLVNGWEGFDREHDVIGAILGTTWNNGSDLTVNWGGGLTNDPRTGGLAGYSNRYISSLVITAALTDSLTYVFQNDLGWQEDNNVFDGGAGAAEWYGINNYLYYTINECWRAGGRFEWFRDDDGARVGAVRPGNQNAPFGLAGHFYEITAGLNWTPTSNLIVRPEVRYDWFDGQSLTGLLPFNAGTDTYQTTFAVDMIFLF
ncbi:MAG TPA: porin [Pirellulaceae bacterium]|nr:porin [Pirellulaceae bacterium]